MTHASTYPPADRSQWYGNGNATVAPTAVLWHTTETAGGWPGYAGGDNAPNLTYEPWQHAWRQHFPLDGTARALANGPDYQTNRMGVCQVEISCYCDPARFSTGKGIDRLDQHAYDDMGAFAGFMAAEWGIPPTPTDLPFELYPDSYGPNNRFTPPQFPPFWGHCGHQHAPYNDHGDPGNFDIARLLAAAGGATAPKQPEEDMGYPIFMATIPDEGGKIYRLAPGESKSHLTPQLWGLYCRLFPYWAQLPGSPYLEAEVDMIEADIQGG